MEGKLGQNCKTSSGSVDGFLDANVVSSEDFETLLFFLNSSSASTSTVCTPTPTINQSSSATRLCNVVEEDQECISILHGIQTDLNNGKKNNTNKIVYDNGMANRSLLPKEDGDLRLRKEEEINSLKLRKEREERNDLRKEKAVDNLQDCRVGNSTETVIQPELIMLTHHLEKMIQELDNDSRSAKPSHSVASDAEIRVAGSEEEKRGGIDVNVAYMHDDEPKSPRASDATPAAIGVVDGEDDKGGGDANGMVETNANVLDNSKGKRKRGRPGKTRPIPVQQYNSNEEEDVCFICFDGGSLVLCDRRGCPKAYHPACVKRDESFFQSKLKWNCGWHICRNCQKVSHYMCLTCTYSLCKGCTKDADFVCVRGNKGFCITCMKTIMLIENITPGNTESVQVDFDDKTSWEYLFKYYWIDLKAKMSLTIDELTKAKNLWKGNELPKAKSSGKEIGSTVFPKEVSFGELNHVDEEKDPSLEKGRNVEKEISLTEATMWATKELLEFVAHMKNGDTSLVSQFDVQILLVEYIKLNNLRDPRQKSQIICDSRLKNLFGRPRLGHFEMLRLLENHFLLREKPLADDSSGAKVFDAVGCKEDDAGTSDSRNDRRCKAFKMMEGTRSHISLNSEVYAAIDVHNINLLYLKRSLIENLMDDSEKFHETVVGSFVRIRILGGDQKQNMYRLVPVVGTSRAGQSYGVGTRTTDVMLEILNLNKTETVSIEGVSNQDISEDECRRLRQSINCGLFKRFKVGEIQEKAMALQPVKVNDTEIARLNHLRDRASENGRMKELREYVEKLDFLKSPKEIQRRLGEIPDVHIDVKMDLNLESEEDAGKSDVIKQGNHVGPRITGFGRKLVERKISSREADQNNVANKELCVDTESKKSSEQGAVGISNQNAIKSLTGLVTSNRNGKATFRSEQHPVIVSTAIPLPLSSGREVLLYDNDRNGKATFQSEHPVIVSAAVPLPLSLGREVPLCDLEAEKIWLYEDPSGKVQGPFSIIHLSKWNSNGFFPPHFRVWRINEKQDGSVLLTDVLEGRFPGRL
ncbi:zinc finger CCCH domain-containing protein 44-like isoform X2 [Mercurialis annua]|uniref:zinc finger CCCH domain-containing protein 44-like isoform X2 n=1 Tax=Mercurialis annua TaxID=3986 RepID=UPI00215F5172|nr:zinc finger CCCH domain-containing protein 44-like isoform X2 [Mercurialis annua]